MTIQTELGAILTKEQGKPKGEAEGEVNIIVVIAITTITITIINAIVKIIIIIVIIAITTDIIRGSLYSQFGGIDNSIHCSRHLFIYLLQLNII